MKQQPAKSHHNRTIAPAKFYGNYFGHTPDDLAVVFDKLVASRRKQGDTVHVLYLAGDSSFDNKHWLQPGRTLPALNGFEEVLHPTESYGDLCYHVNRRVVEGEITHPFLASRNSHIVCINCAVEEATIGAKKSGKQLNAQDEFIRDHLTADDLILLSLGGNDIALFPSPTTICAMGWLTSCSSRSNIVKGSAWGLGRMRDLFGPQLRGYLAALTEKATPFAILPCVIYYPDTNKESPSWANKVLQLIGYNKEPQTVKSIIDRVFQEAKLSLTEVKAVHTVPVALSEAMDGSRSEDYVARVEPSSSGASRIASLLCQKINELAQR